MNLYDLMRSAGGGEAVSKLAVQFGVGEAEMRKAAEALLPAFSLALQRAAADPQAFLELAHGMMNPDYLNAYRQPGAPSAASGAGGLGFLFGSPETARAVAEQASAFTGLAGETMRAIMPQLAAIVMGGLGEQGRKANPFLDAMLKQFDTAGPARPAGKGPLDRYEEEAERRERQDARDFSARQAEMMRSGTAAFEAGAAAWAKAMRGAGSDAASPGATGAEAGAKAFSEMIEPGLKVAEEYRRGLEALLNGRAAAKGTS